MPPKNEKQDLTGLEIAVIGMSGRFPGAPGIKKFWENLKNGVESVTFFPDEELEAAGIDRSLINNPAFVKAKPVLDDKDFFDAPFFGYSPAEAEVMDPQVRLFHEIAWSALEDAGYDPLAYEGPIACYAGSSSSFAWQALSFLSGKDQSLGTWASMLLGNKDNLGTHLAYKLDLKGPCYTFFTACSTSLVAIHLAARALLTGECSMAMAGGICLDTSGKPGYLYQEGMIYSPDGHNRSFDAQAKGTIFGEGGGVVVLKRYKNAQEDGDHIYALIKGSAVNNDGGARVGYTAPGLRGQRDVVKQALKISKVSPDTITMVECHGTATPLGDPVEIAALQEAFQTGKKHYCAVGSVKSNIGHLDTGAGIAGFIKVVLSLFNQQIPASLHYETPNPRVDFENSPFYVNTSLKEWEPGEAGVLRAGVSSFGIGGTNAHVILEQIPSNGGVAASADGVGLTHHLFLLSAKTETALEKMTQNLAEFLQANPIARLEDVSYTLQQGRRVFGCRRMAVVSSVADASQVLLSADESRLRTAIADDERVQPPVVFLFPGLGSEYVNMGRELYEREPYFRDQMDQCFTILEKLIGKDLKSILYTGSNEDVASLLAQPAVNQPVIFAFEYSLAKLLMHWGIKPRALAGYSFGEYAAACIAGVFSLADALQLVVTRGKLVEEAEPGVMLSVPLPQQEVAGLLEEKSDLEIEIAIDNGPSTIVAGPEKEMSAFEVYLKEKKILCMRVPVQRAIHSFMMEPILEAFQREIGKLSLNEPQIPYVTNVTGTWITAQQAVDTAHWAAHMRNTVYFSGCLQTLVKKMDHAVFVEVGPGRDLSALVTRYIPENPGHRIFNLVRHPRKAVDDLYYLLDRLGRLWLRGVKPVWRKVFPGGEGERQGRRISLPTYPFDRHYYPASGDPADYEGGLTSRSASIEKRADIARWFYVPSWKRSALLHFDREAVKPGCRLIFVDNNGVGEPVAQGLATALVDQDVIIARKSTAFEKIGEKEYSMNPGVAGDYLRLLEELKSTGNLPQQIVHCWNIDDNRPGREQGGEILNREMFDQAQYNGLYSLVYLMKALLSPGLGLDHVETMEIVAISTQLYEVTGSEMVRPEKTTISAVLKVIPQEYSFIRCRSIDIESPSVKMSAGEHKVHPYEKNDGSLILIERLVVEILNDSSEPVVAIRDGGRHRWLQVVEPLALAGIPAGSPVRRLKNGGVYLVTGGLGGIGFTLSSFLASTVQAKLILTGRSSLPPREGWQEWSTSHGQDDPVTARLGKIKQLENEGAEVKYFAVDVADKDEMRHVIEAGQEDFGTINGAIHTAGILGGAGGLNFVDQVEEGDFQVQFQAKVYGLIVLGDILAGQELDFCLLTSSLSPLLGGLGFTAYAAANQFMDAFIHSRNRADQPGKAVWTALNWGDWEPWSAKSSEKEDAAKKAIGATINSLNMLPGEGIETFRRIMHYCEAGQVIVSAGDLQARFDQWVRLKGVQEAPGEKGMKKGKRGKEFRRSHLSSSYEAPRSPLEKELAHLWEGLFGFDQLGITDDFFELGGDSLKAVNLAAKIHRHLHVEIPLKQFFDSPTVEQLAGYITTLKDQGSPGQEEKIELAEKREVYPLSSAQERLFIMQQMQEDFTGYNEQVAYELAGDIDREKLVTAFAKVVERHESLRTSFHLIAGQPVQRIHSLEEIGEKSDRLTIESVDHQSLFQFIRPFDLTQPPLVRLGLCEVGPGSANKHLLVVDMHHIIFDGTSSTIFLNDLARYYNGEDLAASLVQYKDYTVWQRGPLQRERLANGVEYWQSVFADVLSGADLPVLELPLDHPRPGVMTYSGELYAFQLSPGDSRSFSAVARQESRTTLYMNVMAALTVLLHKTSGLEDIILGSGTAGRAFEELGEVIGMFVNTLAIRTRPCGEKTYLEYLREVKAACIGAFENQEMPFDDLVERLGIERDPSRNPLFDVCLAYQSFEKPGIPLSGVETRPYELKNKTSRFDMTLFVYEQGEQIVFNLEYYTGIFKEKTIHRFADHLLKIMETIGRNPHQRIAEIEMISPAERQQVLDDFNQIGTAYPREKSIDRLFLEQVERNPGRVAVIGPRDQDALEETLLTYSGLAAKAANLARELDENGITPGTIVGLMVDRSVDMIVAIMGILMAGAAYLPVELDYPPDRVEYMFADSGAKVLVTGAGLKSKIEKVMKPGLQQIVLEKATVSSGQGSGTITADTIGSTATTVNTGDSIVYVIYTSGTTGKPKGVLTKHHNVTRVVKETNYIDIQPGDRLLQLSNVAFDGSVFDIYGALLNGAALVMIAKQDVLTLDRLADIIRREKVSVFFITTALFNTLVDLQLDCFAGVRKVLFGGERVSVEHTRKALEYMGKGRILHVYGPTETTVFASYFPIDCIADDAQTIPIGRPLANTEIYILDKYYHPVPLGVPGEVFIGGDGNALGYLNNPELTSEKFARCSGTRLAGNKGDRQESNYVVKHSKSFCPGPGAGFLEKRPLVAEGKLYKTGDLARWLPGGNLEFIGRVDRQVKLRGFRIELGEIESKLLALPQVKEAVVLDMKDQAGRMVLSAYLVIEKTGEGAPASGETSPGPGKMERETLKQYLARILPPYMIPSSFIFLDKLPLNPSGKVDRKALPQPEVSIGTEYRPPETETEKMMVNIWAEVLGMEAGDIGINDDFFDLGGYSLKATILVARMHEAFNVKIPLSEVFRTPTIRSLSKFIEVSGWVKQGNEEDSPGDDSTEEIII